MRSILLSMSFLLVLLCARPWLAQGEETGIIQAAVYDLDKAVTPNIQITAVIRTSHKRSDREQRGLIGHVTREQSYTAKFSNKSGKWIEGPRVLSQITTYDTRGNTIEMLLYNPGDGSLSTKVNFAYDDNGKVIEEDMHRSDGLLFRKIAFRYDDKGNQAEELWYNGDGSLVEKHAYRYDEKGNMTERISYNAEGSLTGKILYSYDTRGNKAEQASYLSEDYLSRKWVFKYDAKGNMMESAIYGVDGSLYTRHVYTYDSWGNITEDGTYDGDDDSLLAKWVYGYEYDLRGNWTKQTKTKLVIEPSKSYYEPTEVTYRSINYY